MAHRSKEQLAEIYDNSEHKVIKGFRETMNFILGRDVSSDTENLGIFDETVSVLSSKSIMQ